MVVLFTEIGNTKGGTDGVRVGVMSSFGDC